MEEGHGYIWIRRQERSVERGCWNLLLVTAYRYATRGSNKGTVGNGLGSSDQEATNRFLFHIKFHTVGHSCTSVSRIPGVDVDSDQSLVMVNVRIRLQKKHRE